MIGSMSVQPSYEGPAIVAEGLEKRFGSVMALCGVDLEVPQGTVLGLLGPNGAGKTTAVRILTTVLAADRGHAAVLGVDVARAPQAVRELIGLAGQFAAVDENLTGRENLRLVGRLTHQPSAIIRRRSDELLERFGLSDAADRTARTYSGGMRRRLDLAAALVQRPTVLFLDEPTTGLDPSSRNELWQVIKELVGQGMTLLLTTQYLEEADRLADSIVVIDHGVVIAKGTATELKRGMGQTIVEFGLSQRQAAERAREHLAEVGNAELERDERTVKVKVASNRDVFEAVRILDREGIYPDTFVVREPTLDDVFLSLTGHRAEEPLEDAALTGAGRAHRQSSRGAS
jgi:ABC-2 type transport system ATP-binding protein